MTIKQIKKAHNLSDSDIAEAFGYKNANSYRNGKEGKQRLDRGLEWFYQLILKKSKSVGKEN